MSVCELGDLLQSGLHLEEDGSVLDHRDTHRADSRVPHSKEYPTREGEQGEWRLDTDALAAAVTDRTRAIFVANPGTPTGNHLNEEEWEAIAPNGR